MKIKFRESFPREAYAHTDLIVCTDEMIISESVVISNHPTKEVRLVHKTVTTVYMSILMTIGSFLIFGPDVASWLQ